MLKTARIPPPPPKRPTSVLADKKVDLSRHASAQAHYNQVTAGISSSVVAVSKETRRTGGATAESRPTENDRRSLSGRRHMNR